MPPDFPNRLLELLKTNQPLADEEMALTRQILTKRNLSLTDLRRQASECDALLAKIKEEKAMVVNEMAKQREDIQDCNLLLSNSRLLPPEILRSIFLYSLEKGEPPPGVEGASTYHNKSPFVLTQVCRRWRSIAHSNPELWTTFSVCTLKSSRLNVRYEPFKTMMRDFFSRSRNLRKFLEFHYEVDNDESTNEDRDGLLDCVFDSSSINHLSLISNHIPALLHALDAYNNHGRASKRLQQLHSLVLRETEGNRVSELRQPTDSISHSILSNLPHLCRVSIVHKRKANWTAQLLTDHLLPWAQLTHLAITNWIGRETWLRLFRPCTALARAIFYVVNDDNDLDDGNVAHPIVSPTYPVLTDLTLITKNGTQGPLIIQPYKLPSLEKLQLGSYKQPHHSQAFNWHNIQTDIFNLTTLSLCHLTWEVNASEIVELLFATPNLLSLTLGVSTDYNRVFEHFQVDWDGQALLPKLKELSVDCVNSAYDDDNGNGYLLPPIRLSLTAVGFSEAVKDRWRPLDDISQFQHVSLYLPKTYYPVLETIRKSLKVEVEEGLRLTVDTSRRPQWEDPFARTHIWD